MATSSHTDEIGDYLVEAKLNKRLGKGSYGEVYPGKHVRTGREVAAKLLQAEKIYVTKDTDIEARAMMAIPPHENVLKIYDLIKKEVVEHKTYINFWLIIEFCPLGNLVDYAIQNSMLLTDKLDLMLQGNHGLLHLHHLTPKAFVHRDIKPTNMLIAGSRDKAVLKLGDFGEVKIIEQSQVMSSVRGTKSYWAPEMFSLSESHTKPSYEKSVDLFSKGMSDLALLDCGDKEKVTAKNKDGKELGLYLYQNRRQTVKVRIDKATDSEDVKQVKQLLGLMISQNASERPSIQEVVDTLTYLLTTLRAKILQDNPPALLKKMAPSRKAAASGATAQPPPVSARGHLAGASSDVDQAEQLPIHEVTDRLAGMTVRPKTRDVLLAVNTEGIWGEESGLWILTDDTWEKYPIPREMPRYCVCFAAIRTGVVAMGGADDLSTNSAKCFLFSLDTKQWTELPDMITPRRYASAVEIRENAVMVAGGWDSQNNNSAVCEILDISHGQWVPMVSMVKPLIVPLLSALGGRVYILPRAAEKNPVEKTHTRILQEINTVENKITQKAPLAHSRASVELGLVELAEKLYFFSVDNERRDRGQCSQYDPVTDQWSVMEARYPLAYRVPWNCAAVVMDEKILLCGGDEHRTAMVEYNTTTNQGRILSTRLPFRFDDLSSYVGTAHVRV